jgi:hypothetical protein
MSFEEHQICEGTKPPERYETLFYHTGRAIFPKHLTLTMKPAKLIMVVGLPGTGKSTFSRALAADIGACHLNSDVIRTAMGLRGKYTAKDKAMVYRTLRERSKHLLDSGSTVIVDATLYREDLRQPYTKLAQDAACLILWIELHSEEETIKARVSVERPDSEANFAVYQEIKKGYEPLEEDHLSLKTDAVALDVLIRAARKFIDHEPTAN